MRNQKKPTRTFAVCICNEGYPAALELHKIYVVLADTHATKDRVMRVQDDSGDDYLSPADWFVPIKVPRKVAQLLVRAA